MIEEMDADQLAAFVAAVWREQGWQTNVTTREELHYVAVRRDQPVAEHGLILVVADPDGTVGTERLLAFHEFCTDTEAGEPALVTTGSVAPGAKRPAEQRDIGLLDGDDLRDIVRDHDLTDLAVRHGGAEPEPEPTNLVETLRARCRDLRSTAANAASDVPVPWSEGQLSERAVVAAAVVVALLVAGVVVGPSAAPAALSALPGFDDDPEPEPVTARSLTPPESEGVLLVSWDAARRAEIDPDPDDDAAYYPPENRTFLVVELRVVNAGDVAVPVGESGFLVDDNGTVRGHQPLVGTTGFADRTLAPGETHTGWIVFSIDRGSTPALVADANAFGPRNVTVQFSRDPELDVR